MIDHIHCKYYKGITLSQVGLKVSHTHNAGNTPDKPTCQHTPKRSYVVCIIRFVVYVCFPGGGVTSPRKGTPALTKYGKTYPVVINVIYGV